MTGLFRSSDRGGRYSFGYRSLPQTSRTTPRSVELLAAERIGISVSEGFELYPEQDDPCHRLSSPNGEVLRRLEISVPRCAGLVPGELAFRDTVTVVLRCCGGGGRVSLLRVGDPRGLGETNRSSSARALRSVVALLGPRCSRPWLYSAASCSSNWVRTARPLPRRQHLRRPRLRPRPPRPRQLLRARQRQRHQPSSLASGLLSKFQSGEHTTFIATYEITSNATKGLSTLTIAQRSPDQLFGGTSSSGTFEFITLGTRKLHLL